MSISHSTLIADIREIIVSSHDGAIRQADHERTLMYWRIGQRIFEEEQQGKDRALPTYINEIYNKGNDQNPILVLTTFKNDVSYDKTF